MIIGVDTSVVVRLLSGSPEDLAQAALHYLLERRQAGDRVLVSDWVLAETYYALQYHYEVSKKDTLAALRSILSTPGIEGTPEATRVLAAKGLESAKPGFVDRIIHSDYVRTGVDEMVTFEKAAAKLPGVHVLTVQA